VAQLTLADVVYPAGARLPSHSHERAYFCLIRRGSYTETYGRRTRDCRPMTLVFHPPGEPHAQTFSGCPVASFNVEIGSEWLQRAAEWSSHLDQPAEFHGGEVAALGQKLFHEFACNDKDSTVSIEGLTLEILAACTGSNAKACDAPHPRWLADAREMLDARFREPMTLRSIAREAGVHSVYFAAAFRRFYHRSVGEYLRWRRLEYVRGKLLDPELSLAEIALDAGFADQSHLTRNFKRFREGRPANIAPFSGSRPNNCVRLRYGHDEPDMTIAAKMRAEVIDGALKALNDNYVFPDVAKKMEQAIREREKRKEYDSITSARKFAETLADNLRMVSHDGHLRVMYSAEVIPQERPNREPSPEEMERRRAFGARVNFGFEKVERMAGNIGYLDLHGFMAPAFAGDTAAAIQLPWR
jgi:AraC family transcriptional regulator